MIAPAENVEAALNVLESAERLVLVGKGMAWAQAEDEWPLLIELSSFRKIANG